MTSLISGILAWVALPFIGALVAVITGHLARKELRANPAELEGDGLALAGLICGYANFVVACVGGALLLLFCGELAAAMALGQSP